MTTLESKAKLLATLAQRFAWRVEHIYRSASPDNASPLYEQLSAKVATDPDILALVCDQIIDLFVSLSKDRSLNFILTPPTRCNTTCWPIVRATGVGLNGSHPRIYEKNG
jgi:hypothetical protein